MFKIKGYLKKFWYLILACICLLFVQAQTELTLPDYMSDIISVGIQAGGFASPVSDVLTEETYQHLLLFVDQKDQKTVKKDYKKISKVNQDIIDTFPKAKGKTVYQLKDLSSDEESKLESILMKPMLIITSLDSMDTSSKEYQEKFGQLPPNMTIYDAISFMDESQKAKMFEDIDKKMDTMGESTLKIAAGNGVKAEYKKLGADIDKVQTDYIFKTGLKMLGIALLGTVAAISVAFFATKVGAGVARALRKDVFEKVESFSNEEFNHFSTASLITRTTNDITQVQMVTMMLLRIVCFAPIIGIGALIKVLKESPSMTWIIAVVILVIFGVMAVAFAVVMPKFKIIQNLIDCLNLTMRENLSGMLVIRAFGNEKHSEDRFDKANKDVTNLNLFVNRSMASIMPIMMFIFNVVTLVIVYYGSKQIDLGNLAIGQMMAFMQYAMQIIMAFLMIAMIAIMLPRASVAANRVYEIIETKPTIQDPTNPIALDESKKGLVEFNHVSFAYPGASEPVLKDIDFVAKPGQTTAFIGSTGSGKSTLAKHFNALVSPTEGTVWVDGMDTKEDDKILDIRQTAGMVFQNPDNQIICTLVEEEVGFGPENIGVPTDEIWQRVADSLQAVGMYSFRKASPNKLSGGQKQRVAIAGIVAMKPKCIILDEPTAMLDPSGRKEVISVLHELNEKENVTIILITHYMEEVIDADRVFVMDAGKIMMEGTPRQIFSNVEHLKELRLDVPQVTELAYELKKAGVPLPDGILTKEEFTLALKRLVMQNGD